MNNFKNGLKVIRNEVILLLAAILFGILLLAIWLGIGYIVSFITMGYVLAADVAFFGVLGNALLISVFYFVSAIGKSSVKG